MSKEPFIDGRQKDSEGSLLLNAADGCPKRAPCGQTVALAFHAEKLHDPKVWLKLSKTANWLAQKNQKATFFVYPFPAAVSGVDITARVAWLGSLGHEIAQHTHFYAGAAIGKKDKIDDLSDANVVRCLRRDFAMLQASGFTPQGFSAGAWYVTDTVLDSLIALNFSYDCSAQIPRPKAAMDSRYNRWLDRPDVYRSVQGRLLCLPTTCSIGEWFKWGRKIMRDNHSSPRIVYLHDYDLLAFHRHWLLRRFVGGLSGQTLDPLRTIAARYQSMEENCHANNCSQ